MAFQSQHFPAGPLYSWVEGPCRSLSVTSPHSHASFLSSTVGQTGLSKFFAVVHIKVNTTLTRESFFSGVLWFNEIALTVRIRLVS